MFRNSQRCIVCTLVVLCLTIPVSSQVTNSKKFHAVPRATRDRLVERLNLYIEYERTRQHEKLFNLLSDAYISNQHLTRERYLQYRLKDTLVEFKPNAVIKSPIRENVNVFEIHGIAKFQRGNKIVAEDRLLEARLQDNDWYFSDWLVQIND
jgi:hypothetical protein